MPKLPKELQQKLRQSRELRTQGSAPANMGAAGGKGMNRQMRRKMKSQGIEGMEPIEAKRVIIETADGNLVINGPQVIKLNQQGMEIYQVIGKAEESEGSEESDTIEGEEVSENEPMIEKGVPPIGKETVVAPVSLNAEITDQDIELVAMQTGVSKAQAEKALKESNGDLARAILSLKSK